MSEECFTFKPGRQWGHTVFKDGDYHFQFKEDGRLIEFGENIDLVVYREITERGNESKGLIKVLGFINPLHLMISQEKGVLIPESIIRKIKKAEEQEYIRELLRSEYKTEEDIEFL